MSALQPGKWLGLARSKLFTRSGRHSASPEMFIDGHQGLGMVSLKEVPSNGRLATAVRDGVAKDGPRYNHLLPEIVLREEAAVGG